MVAHLLATAALLGLALAALPSDKQATLAPPEAPEPPPACAASECDLTRSISATEAASLSPNEFCGLLRRDGRQNAVLGRGQAGFVCDCGATVIKVPHATGSRSTGKKNDAEIELRDELCILQAARDRGLPCVTQLCGSYDPTSPSAVGNNDAVDAEAEDEDEDADKNKASNADEPRNDRGSRLRVEIVKVLGESLKQVAARKKKGREPPGIGLRLTPHEAATVFRHMQILAQHTHGHDKMKGNFMRPSADDPRHGQCPLIFIDMPSSVWEGGRRRNFKSSWEKNCRVLSQAMKLFTPMEAGVNCGALAQAAMSHPIPCTDLVGPGPGRISAASVDAPVLRPDGMAAPARLLRAVAEKKRGWLSKQSEWLKQWRQRYSWFEGTKLLFSESPRKPPHVEVDLAAAGVRVTKGGQRDGYFEFDISRANGQTLRLRARDFYERQQWMRAIEAMAPAAATTSSAEQQVREGEDGADGREEQQF